MLNWADDILIYVSKFCSYCPVLMYPDSLEYSLTHEFFNIIVRFSISSAAILDEIEGKRQILEDIIERSAADADFMFNS